MVMVARAEVERWVADDAIRLDPRFLGYRSGDAAPVAVSRAAALVKRAMLLAEATSQVLPLDHPRSALHGQLMDAVLAVLQSLQPVSQVRKGRPSVDAKRILVEVVHLMEDRLDDTSRIPDYCAAVGISTTTLRKVFHESLGMSPQRYLQTRRLHAVRWALKQAGPQDTISSICGQYGIWDFGRFSGQFRQLFGVLPSSMLKRD
jgi:AraC family ethanolamine operon transcriptional activator